MTDFNDDVTKYFWLPPNYYNKCSSGANKYTIESATAEYERFKKNRYFQKCILPKLRLLASSNLRQKEKFIPRSSRDEGGFRDVVNDALSYIYSKKVGYVFSEKQLLEVLRFVPLINATYDGDVYFVFG